MKSSMKNTIRKYHIIKPLLVWVLCLHGAWLFADVHPAYSAKPLYSTSQSSVWSKQHSKGGAISPIGATGITSYGGVSSSSIGGTSFGTRSNVSLSFNYDRQYSVGATNPTSIGKRRLDGEESGNNPSQPLWPPVGDIPFVLMLLFAAGYVLISRLRKSDL